jgi:urease accessory protein
MATDWLLWQLADSAFPAGSFAHSGGLEAAWQSGLLDGCDALGDFLRAVLAQAACGAVPLAVATCREPERFEEVDGFCDAFLSNHVANRASRGQGQALLAAAGRVFRVPRLTEFAAGARASRPPGHLAPVFGVVANALDVDPERAGRLFLFLSLRGLTSAAVRLGVVGPLEAQSIQYRLAADAERYAAEALRTPVEDVAQTAPLLDLAQGGHDRLYSRLFQS